MVSQSNNSTMSKEETNTTTRRKGLFSRLRMRKNKTKHEDDVREAYFDTADVQATVEAPRVEAPERSKTPKIAMKPDMPPEADKAAFHGPPRYDWMDIETAAAVKVQSAFRRNKVMNDLEAQKKSTAAIRRRQLGRAPGYETSTSLMDCCGVSLVFEEDADKREEDRQEYERQRETRLAKDVALRHEYAKMKKDVDVREAFEVVDEDE